jgi:phage/plasmid-associated DNA primase
MYTARHCGTYLYLIHVQDNVYKVGYSTNLDKRVHNYPKPYKVVLSIEVGAGRQAERVVLDCFKQRFKQRTDLGTEYFEGSKTDMISHITSVASRFCGDDGGVLPSTMLQKRDAMHVVLDFAGPIIGDRVTIPIADFYGELQRACTEKGFITPNMEDVSRYVNKLFHGRISKTDFVFKNDVKLPKTTNDGTAHTFITQNTVVDKAYRDKLTLKDAYEAYCTGVDMILPSCEDIVFSPESKGANCNGMYVYNSDTHLWSQKHNCVIEEMIVRRFILVRDQLEDRDFRHVMSRRGRADMVHILASKRVVEGFANKLDVNLDIFAVDNGCFDSSCNPVTFRHITRDDMVNTTAGWSYDKTQAIEKRPVVEEFLEQLLPIPEERSLVLAFIALSFTGKKFLKKLLAFTDKRSGNNGKYTLVSLLKLFFGKTAAVNTKFVCKGGIDSDRDSHDAGLESMRAKRAVIAEELKSCMRLDDALIKRITGGGDVRWQASVFLIFNENDCPKFDSTDTSAMGRFIVAPFRSKFVSNVSAETDEPWTFPVDPAITDKFHGWLSAFADILIDNYPRDIAIFDDLPQAMKEWKSDVTLAANPLVEWFEANVQITRNFQKDHMSVSELKTLHSNTDSEELHLSSADFIKFAKTYFVTAGASYHDKTSATIDGVYKSSVRHIIKGAKLIR